MNFSDIQLFVTAARKRGLREAGIALELPASTISRAITRIEKKAGILLLERSIRGVKLTDAGRDYLTFCEQALQRLQDADDYLDSHRHKPKGKLTIGLPTTFAREMVLPFLRTFSDTYPDLRIRFILHECDYPGPPEDVDVDIFFQAGAPRSSSWKVRPLPSIAMCLAASPDYLKRAGVPKTPEELPRHRFVSWGPGGENLTLILRSKKELTHVTVPLAISITHAGMQNRLAQDGLGIGYIQRWEAQPALERGTLRIVLPDWEPEAVPFYALYRQRASMMPKIGAFMEMVSKHLAEESDPRKPKRKGRRYFAQNGSV